MWRHHKQHWPFYMLSEDVRHAIGRIATPADELFSDG